MLQARCWRFGRDSAEAAYSNSGLHLGAHSFMFADGQMQNGHADAAGKRWRPQAAKQRGKLAQRAVIIVAGVLLFFLGAKVRSSACTTHYAGQKQDTGTVFVALVTWPCAPLQLGPSASKGLSNAHVSEMASTVTSSLHLTGGAQVSLITCAAGYDARSC